MGLQALLARVQRQHHPAGLGTWLTAAREGQNKERWVREVPAAHARHWPWLGQTCFLVNSLCNTVLTQTEQCMDGYRVRAAGRGSVNCSLFTTGAPPQNAGCGQQAPPLPPCQASMQPATELVAGAPWCTIVTQLLQASTPPLQRYGWPHSSSSLTPPPLSALP